MSDRAAFVAVPYRYSLSLPSRPVSPKPHPSSGYSLLTPTIQAQRWVASHNFDQRSLISYLIAQDPLTRASIETKAFVSDAASRWRRCLALTPGHCLDSIRLSSKISSPAFLSYIIATCHQNGIALSSIFLISWRWPHRRRPAPRR